MRAFLCLTIPLTEYFYKTYNLTYNLEKLYILELKKNTPNRVPNTL